PSWRARRGDADARVQPLHRLPDAYDAFQLPLEGRKDLSRQRAGKILRQRRAAFGLDPPQGSILAHAKKTIARLLVAEAQARLAEHAARDAERDDLAVDEHAIAVEDDDFRPPGRAHRLADFALRPLEDVERAALTGVKRRDRADRRSDAFG